MPRFLFRNRWIALAWALGVLASIGLFFSEGGGQEQLARATETLRGNAGPPRPAPDAGPVAFEEEEPVGEEADDAGQEPRRVRLASSGGEAGDDDGAETYVILEQQTADPEGAGF